jgi:BirA family biotin operon repressor/biotin-[acetyl-CoA-carboxylase] ligase
MPQLDINRLLRETFVVEVEHHAELGSTNDRAAQRAKQGTNKLPLLVIADRQTAGRGRGGNRWWTGQGSLAFSILLAPETANAKTEECSLGRQFNCHPNNLVSLAAGVAVAETIKPLLPDKEVGIHWPNDAIVAGRKLAGILVEVLPSRHTVIGIGINTNNSLAQAPRELLATATTLLELTGNEHDHTAILIALLNRLEKHLLTLKKSPDELAALANELCLQRDKSLTLQLGAQTITGQCRGIAPDGALLIQTSSGLRSFYSGIVGGTP